MSMDPCEVPYAGGLLLSRLALKRCLFISAPFIGIGALNAPSFGDTVGELSDLHGELLGWDGLTEEDVISRDGPETMT